jgi:hypothetical protein
MKAIASFFGDVLGALFGTAFGTVPHAASAHRSSPQQEGKPPPVARYHPDSHPPATGAPADTSPRHTYPARHPPMVAMRRALGFGQILRAVGSARVPHGCSAARALLRSVRRKLPPALRLAVAAAPPMAP